MRFTSYKASNMSVDQLLDSLNVTDTRHTGVLFSSWHYTRNIAGNTEITANPFKIIASSTAPLFALWPSSVKNSGVVGGFTYDVSVYNRQIIKTFNTILEGRQPRDIPFYTPQDARPVFNYAALERKDLSPHTCPANTLFYNKPVSTLEQYKWAIGGIVLLLLAFIGGMFIEKSKGNPVVSAVGLVLGDAACYVLGTAWFVFQMQCELGYALTVCVYPFIALDLAKIVVSCIVGALLRKRLTQAGVLKLQNAVSE